MSIKQALFKFRKAGFTTTKENGTWYLSKPYRTAECLVTIDGVVNVKLNYNGEVDYQTIEQFEENGGFVTL